MSSGEAIGVQEYRYVFKNNILEMELTLPRYGLKVTVMIIAPHPLWVSKRGLEIVGPRVFNLPYDYTSPLIYTKARSVIEEYTPRET